MNVAFWTRLSIAGLIALPPVIFVLFLRDAAALFRGLREGSGRSPASGGGAGARDP